MIKKLYEMLPSREKGETFIIALLMFIGMLFETLGVGLVVPVVSLLIDQNSLIIIHLYKTLFCNLLL